MKNIYIHLPFCIKKCPFCVFPVHFLGNSPQTNIIDHYLSLLKQELELFLPFYTKNGSRKTHLESLYFGGGTPSLMAPHQLQALFSILRKFFIIDKETESSIEINPETLYFNKEKAKEYQSIGINRFSLGIQSFNEKQLKTLKRNYSLKEILLCMDILHNLEGEPKISYDLLTDLPHENEEIDFLPYINQYNPLHLSIYSLIIEPESIFSIKNKYSPYKFPLPNEEKSAEKYRKINEELTKKGYTHYEISSYCKENQNCIHNMVYWQGDIDYMAFGMGATGLYRGLRVTRPKSVKKYEEFVKEISIKNIELLINSEEMLGKVGCEVFNEEKGLERIKTILMGGLRTKNGVSINKLMKISPEIIYIIEQFIKEYGDVIGIIKGYLILKEIKGFLLCDEILARLFVQLEKKINIC